MQFKSKWSEFMQKKCPIAPFILLNNHYKIYQLQLIKPIQFTYDKYNMT